MKGEKRRNMNITGKTVLVGIFGHPVEHTFSPAMHNAAFDRLGLNWCYLPFHVLPERLGEAVEAIRALGLRGVNVTVPHKEGVIRYLDRVDEEAARIGAVNTVVNEDGVLVGYNTDGKGFVRSLEEADIIIGGKKIIVLGAGGAARAVCFSLLSAGASDLLIVNRTLERAKQLADDINAVSKAAKATGSLSSTSGYDILVNTTSLGLHNGDPMPIEDSLLNSSLFVCDLIYNPARTHLMCLAEQRGCKTINGLGMLLWQGVLAFNLWTGIMPPVEVMSDALRV